MMLYVADSDGKMRTWNLSSVITFIFTHYDDSRVSKEISGVGDSLYVCVCVFVRSKTKTNETKITKLGTARTRRGAHRT